MQHNSLGKLFAATRCVQEALEIDHDAGYVYASATTHLNLCTMLSKLNKHSEALVQGQEAVKILEAFEASVAAQGNYRH